MADRRHQLVFLGFLIEGLVETAVNGETGHERIAEFLIRHAGTPLHQHGRGVDHHVPEVDLNLVARNGVAPAGIDGFTLEVHHVVVFEQALADTEVVLFHLLLRLLDGIRKHRALEGLVVLHPQTVYHAGDSFRAEKTHQFVFE